MKTPSPGLRREGCEMVRRSSSPLIHRRRRSGVAPASVRIDATVLPSVDSYPCLRLRRLALWQRLIEDIQDDLNREHLLRITNFSTRESPKPRDNFSHHSSGKIVHQLPMVCPLSGPLSTVLARSSRSLSTQASPIGPFGNGALSKSASRRPAQSRTDKLAQIERVINSWLHVSLVADLQREWWCPIRPAPTAVGVSARQSTELVIARLGLSRGGALPAPADKLTARDVTNQGHGEATTPTPKAPVAVARASSKGIC